MRSFLSITVMELVARLIIMYFLLLISNLFTYLFLCFRNATLFNTVLILVTYTRMFLLFI